MLRCLRLPRIVFVALLVGASGVATAKDVEGPDIVVVAEARNVPVGLPVIRVVKEKLWGKYYPMVSVTFPNVPEFTCDSWCYESAVEFEHARPLENGAVEMAHHLKKDLGVLVVTTITPEVGAVEIEARMATRDEDKALSSPPIGLNLCWQLRNAPGFASAPDPYPTFVKRCFVFTPEGAKSLLELDRKSIPVQAADHEYNNPPWVQMYVGTWQDVPPRSEKSWADYSDDRYTTTVIGATSRDGRFLTAIANDSATSMSQAWHDCMHNNPAWLPADAPVAEKRWRVKIYAMKNDPDALLNRFGKDFSNARHLKEE